MSRNLSGVYALPAGSIVATGDTILPAQHNTPLNDIASDLNLPRPVVAGGTGADNAPDALVNLGLTATAAEINLLDGVTWTLVDYNTLTSTAAELNILDGVTATATELNILDGLTGIASQAQAEAGTASDVLMTPQRTEQHMIANAIGWGQTWQNVIGSRAVSTSYQNTTGRPIAISIVGSVAGSGVFLQVSDDNSTWIDVSLVRSGDGPTPASAVIPNSHYYRVNGAAGIATWAELR